MSFVCWRKRHLLAKLAESAMRSMMAKSYDMSEANLLTTPDAERSEATDMSAANS
jgi:hypothetical protein